MAASSCSHLECRGVALGTFFIRKRPCRDSSHLRCKRDGEESPDSTRKRCQVTPGRRGDPSMDSATENRPPLPATVRVKRCGKSAPPDWQQDGHGKPHREQCRIGIAWGCKAPGPPWPQQVRVGSLRRRGDPASRGMVIEGAGQPVPEQNPAYRSSAHFGPVGKPGLGTNESGDSRCAGLDFGPPDRHIAPNMKFYGAGACPMPVRGDLQWRSRPQSRSA